MQPRPVCVVTTIQAPTECMHGLARALRPIGSKMIVVGDKKGPASFDLAGADFYSLARQLEMPQSLAKLLPTGHYARKNLGYLIAIGEKAPCIYETDDDNAPDDRWKPLPQRTTARTPSGRKWLNVYKLFTDDLIWPRGLPLNCITDPATFSHEAHAPLSTVTSPIHQGLADGSPDVDAVWRLVLDRDFRFDTREPVSLAPGTWCPFNSQNTWWWPEAYPLLYLPSFCSFRMTDIWRSFVAQRCLWELGHGLVFHPADVVQLRNIHNLMRDFKDEVSGYERNDELVNLLTDTKLTPGAGNVGANLLKCYERLQAANFFNADEVKLVTAWLADLHSVT